jgi:hypothetical protein
MGKAKDILDKFEAKLIISIKPTKHNQKVFKKRGLFSDDSQRFFNLFNAIMGGKDFLLDSNADKIIVDELLKMGVKF